MALQGITLAISPNGIQVFFENVVSHAIVAALQKVSPPDHVLATKEMGIFIRDTSFGDIPGQRFWADYFDASISGGRVADINATFGPLTQAADGHFSVNAALSAFSVIYNWQESYYEKWEDSDGMGHRGSKWHAPQTYTYTQHVQKLDLPLLFVFEINNSGWKPKLLPLKHVLAIASKPDFPTQSILKAQENCLQPKADASTTEALSKLDLTGALTTALTSAFDSVAQTGKVTSDVAVEFSGGPDKLTFPLGGGIAMGMTGNVTYRGKPSPVANPPQLRVPPVPQGKHLNYYVSDYTFNAFMWAFFSSGALSSTIGSGDLDADHSDVLTTGEYKGSALEIIWKTYPDKEMSAACTAKHEPTVTFEPVYQLTEDNLDKIKPPVTTDQVFAKLKKNAQNRICPDEASFFKLLTDVLGAADAAKYKVAIERAASRTLKCVVHKSTRVVLNVLDGGKTIPVITFDVDETDVLEDMQLGVAKSGLTQTLKYAFVNLSHLTTTTFVSSPFPKVDSDHFAYIWKHALHDAYKGVYEGVGKHGIALPRIEGFDFIAEHAAIALEQGYVSVLADVRHKSG